MSRINANNIFAPRPVPGIAGVDMSQRESTTAQTSTGTKNRVRWQEMRCAHCGRLLQKVEENALRPGKQLEIKCGHCKVMNYLVGGEPNNDAPVRQKP